jgi:hypothetical protein
MRCWLSAKEGSRRPQFGGARLRNGPCYSQGVLADFDDDMCKADSLPSRRPSGMQLIGLGTVRSLLGVGES